MKSILIVDDEPNVHYSFKRILPKNYRILSANSGEETLVQIKAATPDLVIIDVKMPGMNGLETLLKIREIDGKLPVIIMTAYGTMQTAIEAMRLGAYEYIVKPFDVLRMQEIIEKALAAGELMKRIVTYPSLLKREEGMEMIVGSSPAMQEVYKVIGQVAEKDVTVLLRGESGTGKELVARAIYQHSRRANKPFIVINSAAIPDALLESELFGYEKGAFTGALERRIGKFEQGNGGTIFLDEIGDMSLSTQMKILRLIQEGEFMRLGGEELIKVNVRLIVATNKDLKRAIQEGRFREDLYYRLNVISINLPPLRERKEDIPELVKYFLEKFNRELGKKVGEVSPAAMRKLKDYDWPGNVRELENCIKRAVILSKTGSLEHDDFQFPVEGERRPQREDWSLEESLGRIVEAAFSGKGKGKIISMVERTLILKALEKTGGNQVQAARLLGIARNTLRNRMEKYNIKKNIKIS